MFKGLRMNSGICICRRIAIIACGGVALPCLVSTIVYAEPRESPEFYKKGFAESPIERPSNGRGAGDSDSIDVSGSAILGLHESYKKQLREQTGMTEEDRPAEVRKPSEVGAQPQGQKEETAQQGSKGAAEESDVFGDEPGVPVLAIGGVISAMEQAHFNDKLRQLTDVARKHDLEMGRVYAVGDWSRMMAGFRIFAKVIARKGHITSIQEVPPQFKITRSPTWIIETREGDIVVEGVEPLGKYFNKKGEFVESKLKEAVVSVAPSPS